VSPRNGNRPELAAKGGGKANSTRRNSSLVNIRPQHFRTAADFAALALARLALRQAAA
jgi:hypothetical protein